MNPGGNQFQLEGIKYSTQNHLASNLSVEKRRPFVEAIGESGESTPQLSILKKTRVDSRGNNSDHPYNDGS